MTLPPLGQARTEGVARLVSTTFYGGAKRRLTSGGRSRIVVQLLTFDAMLVSTVRGRAGSASEPLGVRTKARIAVFL